MDFLTGTEELNRCLDSSLSPVAAAHALIPLVTSASTRLRADAQYRSLRQADATEHANGLITVVNLNKYN